MITHSKMVTTVVKDGGQIADDLNANAPACNALMKQLEHTLIEGMELDKVKKVAIYNATDSALINRYLPNRAAVKVEAEQAHILHMVIGIIGEACELGEAVLKHLEGERLDIDNVIEELGDLEFYMEGFRQGVRTSRDTTLKNNIEKLSVRYEGLEYSDEAAQTRADKA